MALDRAAQMAGWAGELIRAACLAQGWADGDWEYATSLATIPTPSGPAVMWQVMLSLDSGLIGKPPLVTMTPVPGGTRPERQQVSDAIAGAMQKLWAARLRNMGVAAAVQPASGKIRAAAGPVMRLPPPGSNGHGKRG